MKSIIKSLTFPLLLLLTVILTSFNNSDEAFQVVGVWESEEKNLQIEMFEDGDKFAGRMIYFKCSSQDIMRASVDSENPIETLRDRKLLGMKLVYQLAYQGQGVWDHGKIYDPNSGRTFEARIQLKGPSTAIVRGYWKYKWFGRSMVFNRKF